MGEDRKEEGQSRGILYDREEKKRERVCRGSRLKKGGGERETQRDGQR